MEKYSSVKIRGKTLEKLHMMASKLALKKGKRLNLDETIDSMIDIVENSESMDTFDKEKQDRTEFLQLFKKKLKGAGPTDYISYDFEDLSKI